MESEYKELVETRWSELPDSLKELFVSPAYETGLREIATHYGLDEDMYTLFRAEVTFVLFVFEPISSLQKNLTAVLGLSGELSSTICSELELTLLYSVKDTLYEIAQDPEFIGIRDTPSVTTEITHSNIESKERLDLRPEVAELGPIPPSSAKPLTRDELLKALNAKRTMAGDIEAVRQKQEGGKNE